MNGIDPRAIIHPDAILGEGVTVGPWTTIGADVVLGDGCEVSSHVVLKGPTHMGRNNRIFQFSSIGEDTPDLKYQGEPTKLIVGDNNIFREGVTVHRGTVQDKGETRIGSDNLIMAYAHIGHDSVLGDHCIMINNAALAGHVHLGDWVILGGFSMIHQFVSVGAHCFTGMGAAVRQDIPAYVTVHGHPATPGGINVEGLKRRGFSSEAIMAIRRAYKILYRQGNSMEEALSRIEAMRDEAPELDLLLESIRGSTRGIVR